MRRLALALALIAGLTVVPTTSSAAPSAVGQSKMSDQAKAMAAYWTAERIRNAIPRDIVVDDQGRSFIRGANGLEPYGTNDRVKLSKALRTGGATATTTSSDVANAQYSTDSPVLKASGRILFDMPANKSLTRWTSYVCSGTVINDGSISTDGSGTSTILTAAHCVYDDADKAFARNVIFIPNQQSSGTKTDRNCTNDIYGCWVASAGYVDVEWTTRTWPNNIPWDYGYYVIKNSGSHTQATSATVSDTLEVAVTPMAVSFSAPSNSRSSAYGYSYNADPKLMYCAQTRGFTGGSSAGSSDNWWLDKCGLSGGASGGPWLDESSSTGSGTVFSVNSWGYSTQPGMAGPKLSGTSLTVRARTPQCVFSKVQTAASGTLNSVAISGSCP